MEQEQSSEEEKYANWKAPDTNSTAENNPPEVRYSDGKRLVLEGLTAKENGAYMYGEQEVTKDPDGRYWVPNGNDLRNPRTGEVSALGARELAPEEVAQHIEGIGQQPDNQVPSDSTEPETAQADVRNPTKAELEEAVRAESAAKYEAANRRFSQQSETRAATVSSQEISETPQTVQPEIMAEPQPNYLVEKSREVTASLQGFSESLPAEQAEGLNASIGQVEQLLNNPDAQPIDISRSVDQLGRAVSKLTPEGVNSAEDDPEEVAARLDKQTIDRIADSLSAFGHSALEQAHGFAQQVRDNPDTDRKLGYYAGAMSGLSEKVIEQSSFWESVRFYKEKVTNEDDKTRLASTDVDAGSSEPIAQEPEMVSEHPEISAPEPQVVAENAAATEASGSAVKPEENIVEPVPQEQPLSEEEAPKPKTATSSLEYSAAKSSDNLGRITDAMRHASERGTPMDQDTYGRLSSVRKELLDYSTATNPDGNRLISAISNLDRALQGSIDRQGLAPSRETPNHLRNLAGLLDGYRDSLRNTVSWALEKEGDPNIKAELERAFSMFNSRLDGQVNYLHKKSEMAKRLVGG